ncbi:MAG: glycosyltransferase [Myxococcales bacterium]|nr:glycosyltransferase [Myxococcales bacterium]
MARILITGFCSIPSPGRPGVQLGHIIDGLQRRHQVDVLSVRREDQGHVERVGGTRYLRVPLPGGDLSSQIEVFRRALRRQLEGAEYDVVHFRDGWSGVTALEVQSTQGYATVFDLARSPMAEPVLADLATSTELERAEQTCVRRADLILVPTEAAKQYLVGFTNASKIHVVPPGVNVDRFDWEALNEERAPVILYLGSLTPGRGVRVLLRSMLDVAAVSDAILVLAGPATKPFMESLETAVLDLGLAGRVRLLGEVPHELAPAVIARATVCVAPGAAELEPKPTALFPSKILEYMACRRAVVAPSRGTVTMLFRDREEALLFKSGAPDDLAEKILLLLRDAKLRDRVAGRGYEMVRANCTASGTRRSLRRAYDWLAEQDAFRERLGQPGVGDPRLAPITELGLALSVGQSSQSDTSQDYAGNEIGSDDAFAVNSPSVDTGDVTRVEALPVRSGAEHMQRSSQDISGFLQTEAIEEGTSEWDVALAVIEDTGSVDIGSARSSTVVTPRLDEGLVAGELQSKTARIEHARPIDESDFDGEATSISAPQDHQSIPPANHSKAKPFRSSAAKSTTGKGMKQHEKTRVLVAADIEELVTSAPAGVKSEEDGASSDRTRVAIGATPRPPKLPRRKRPGAAPSAQPKKSARGGPPRLPVAKVGSPVDSSVETRVSAPPTAKPASETPKAKQSTPSSDRKSSAPDDLG